MTGMHRPRRPGRTRRPRRRARQAAEAARPASDPARQTAYDVLAAVRERDAYANLVLPGLLRDRRLDTRDAALATELAYGTLRAQGPARRGAAGLRRPAAGPRSTRRCSTCCGWAPTSCCAPACRRTRR